MRRLALLIAAPLLLLAACSSAGAPARGAPGGGGGDTFTNIGAPLPVPAPEAQKAAGGVAVAQPASQGGIPNVVFNADRNLILTANISMRSKDPWATSDRIQAITAGLGGDLLSLAQAGTSEDRRATLTIRVPSSRFGDALDQIKRLDGEVVTSNVDAKDVTDQFVDLQARLGAKKAEEQRYLTILTRANTIDEILKVDGALANVRMQIEQLTAQVNSIKSRTDFSTIVVSVTPLTVLPIDNTAKGWDPAKTLARALASFAALFQVLGDIAIWALVFGFVPLLGLAIVAVATRNRRPRSAPVA